MIDSTNMTGLQKNDKNSILTEMRNRKNTKLGINLSGLPSNTSTISANSVPSSNTDPIPNAVPAAAAINVNMKTNNQSLSELLAL